MKIINFFNIVYYLTKKKNVAYVNSPFQILNLIEIIKKKEINISETVLFYGLGPKQYNNKLKYIKILNILKINNFYLLEFKIGEKIFFILVLIFRIIKKYNYIIIGNIFTGISDYLLSLNSKFKYFVDDGTSTLFINDFYKLKSSISNRSTFLNDNKNYNFFTFFEISPLNFTCEKNNFSYLKSLFLLKNKNVRNYLLILGNAYIEKNILNQDTYFNIILKIKKKFPKIKIKFLKHPIENENLHLNIFLIKNNIEIIKYNNYPAELQILLFNEFPKYIISHNSTTLFSLAEILKSYKNIKIMNLKINNNLLISHQKKINIINRYKSDRVKKIKL
jgi:hypothetical protein